MTVVSLEDEPRFQGRSGWGGEASFAATCVESSYGGGGEDNIEFVVNSGLHHVRTEEQGYDIDETDEKETTGYGVELIKGEQWNNPNAGEEGEEPAWVLHGPVWFGGDEVREELIHGVRSFKELAGVVAESVAEDDTRSEPKGGLG